MGYNLDDDRHKLASTFESGLMSGSQRYFDTHEFIEIIDFFLDQNETLKAEKAINNALFQHPYSIIIQIRKADWLYEIKNYKEAEKEIDAVLEIEESNSEANELKGDLLIQREKQVEGISYLQKALENAEEKAEILSKIGVELMQLNKFEIALSFFLKVLDEEVSDESALYNCTYCFELLEKPVDAIIFLNKYINKIPYSQTAWHQLGLQYKILEDYSRAIWAFDYAIIIDETFLGAYFEKAVCLEELKEFTQAIDIYKKAQSMADPTAWTCYRLGVVYDKLKETDQALINYFKAIHEDPMYSNAWYKIAISYSNNANLLKALEYAEKAVEIEYDNVEFNILLARLYMNLSKFDAADSIYENLISFEVDDADIWIEYAILLKSIGHKNDSISIMLRALGYFPENVEIMYRLTGCLFNIERDLEAIDLLREALILDFDKKEILKQSNPLVFNSEIVQDMIFAQKQHGRFL